MNIIICGAGKVGFSISKQLSSQGHSVSVIDQSKEDIKKINDTLQAILKTLKIVFILIAGFAFLYFALLIYLFVIG